MSDHADVKEQFNERAPLLSTLSLTSASQPLEFMNLPFELRCKIYMAAFPSSRILEICPVAQKCGEFRPKLMTPTPFLHVSGESRRETLKAYRLVFPAQSSFYAGYINPNEDTLFLNDKMFVFGDAVKELDQDLLENVKTLALDAFSMIFPLFPIQRGLKPILIFKNLNKLILVLANSFPKDTAIVLIDPFTVPLLEWRKRGIERNDRVLLTSQARDIHKTWNRGTVMLSQHVLDGVESLLLVLDNYARDNPEWNRPTIEIKSLAKS